MNFICIIINKINVFLYLDYSKLYQEVKKMRYPFIGAYRHFMVLNVMIEIHSIIEK